MTDLRPCPFCGGVAKLNAPGYEYYSPYWCKCIRCGAEGPTKSSELEAEKGWNERVQDDGENVPIINGNLQHRASYKQVRKALKINGFRKKLARNLQQNQVTVK